MIARHPARLAGAFAGAVVAATLLVHLPGFVHQLFDPDEAAIATQAVTLRHGGTLYVDAIDRKPPIPGYLYAGVFDVTGSTDLRPVHLVVALLLAGAAVVIGLEARRRHGLVGGWWAAALMVTGIVGFLPTNGQAANYAQIALLPATVAVVAARRGSWRWALLAGVALGLAVLCRQTWAIGLLPGAVAVRAHGRWRDVPVFVAGCVAVVASVGLVVPFGAFWSATFTGNGSFVTSGAEWGSVLTAFGGNLGLFVAFHVVAVALLIVAARRGWRSRDAVGPDLDLWLWLLTGGVAVIAGFRFYGHYWLQLLPPLVLLVAPVAAGLGGRARAWAVGLVAVPTLVAVALAFVPGTVRTLPDPQPLASYVDSHTTPDQRVLVWGNFAQVYWAADRMPAGAFVTSNFVTGLSGDRTAGPGTFADATPGARSTFLESLRTNPPALVLDTSTAGLNDYGHYPLSSVPALAALVRAHYRVVAIVDRVTVYAADGPRLRQ